MNAGTWQVALGRMINLPTLFRTIAVTTACEVAPLDTYEKRTPTWVQKNPFPRQPADFKHNPRYETVWFPSSFSYKDLLLEAFSKPSYTNFFQYHTHTAKHEKKRQYLFFSPKSMSQLCKQSKATSYLTMHPAQTPHNQEDVLSKHVHSTKFPRTLEHFNFIISLLPVLALSCTMGELLKLARN